REIFSDAGYPPQLRCEQVNGRFNRLSEREPNGIEIITTGFLNGLPVVYSPASGRDRPSSSNLLFTLSKGEDAVRVVQGLFDLRAGRTVSGSNPKPLSESSADGKTITI
ncbi:MAG: COP23 domain-containing protein, partial [Microcystis panniformis]